MPKELIIKGRSMNNDGETRTFQVGDKRAAREYLNKNMKWRFGTVLRKRNRKTTLFSKIGEWQNLEASYRAIAD